MVLQDATRNEPGYFKNTPRKTNMSPENQWLEDVFPDKLSFFGGHVSFRGIYWGIRNGRPNHQDPKPQDIPEGFNGSWVAMIFRLKTIGWDMFSHSMKGMLKLKLGDIHGYSSLLC